MDKTILSLLFVGIVLALLHVSSVLVPLIVIGGLAIVAIRLFWMVLQAFSATTARPCPVRNN